MELLNYAMNAVKLYWRDLAVVGAIMVSAIIVIIGLLKPIVFNRIPYKPLRKSALAFSDVLLSFIATAIYFVIRDINWEFYWLASLITSTACIITYWLYENTCFRNLIQKLGTLTIDKFSRVAKLAILNEDSKEIEAELKKATEEIKATAKTEIKAFSQKSLTKDKELENL